MIKVHLSRILGEKKLRAADVAKATGINKNTLSALYNETKLGIQFETLAKLCEYLNCSVSDLLEYIPKKK